MEKVLPAGALPNLFALVLIQPPNKILYLSGWLHMMIWMNKDGRAKREE